MQPIPTTIGAERWLQLHLRRSQRLKRNQQQAADHEQADDGSGAWNTFPRERSYDRNQGVQS
jgi:hypothetical protein